MVNRLGQRAASVSLVLVFVFLVLLSLLHFLEPEYNGSGQLISLYELGQFGVLMRLAFLSIGGSVIVLSVALWRDLEDRRGRLGGWWLAFIGAAFIGAGVFAPDKGVGLASSVPLSLAGSLHTVFGLFVILTAPIAFSVTGGSLRRNPQWSGIAYRLRWASLLSWVGLAVFFGSLVLYGVSQQSVTATLVSVTNRFMVVTYSIWVIVLGWQKKKEASVDASKV